MYTVFGWIVIHVYKYVDNKYVHKYVDYDMCTNMLIMICVQIYLYVLQCISVFYLNFLWHSSECPF